MSIAFSSFKKITQRHSDTIITQRKQAKKHVPAFLAQMHIALDPKHISRDQKTTQGRRVFSQHSSKGGTPQNLINIEQNTSTPNAKPASHTKTVNPFDLFGLVNPQTAKVKAIKSSNQTQLQKGKYFTVSPLRDANQAIVTPCEKAALELKVDLGINTLQFKRRSECKKAEMRFSKEESNCTTKEHELPSECYKFLSGRMNKENEGIKCKKNQPWMTKRTRLSITYKSHQNSNRNCEQQQGDKGQYKHRTEQKSKYPAFIHQRSQQRGLSIADFELCQELGQGKYGQVKLARHRKTGLLVALKQFCKEQIKLQKVQMAVLREIKIMSYLRHPNIIKFYGCFHDAQSVYLICEYCPDGSLQGELKRNREAYSRSNVKTLPKRIKATIADIFEAVSYMHSEGVLHRDIKPDNVVKVWDTHKLCDLGWAAYTRRQVRSTFCGTPLYVSPEVLQGLQYDEKADVWGLGVLTYELIYGEVPFSINRMEDLGKIICQNVHFPAVNASQQRLLLQQMVQQMLQKKSEDRPSMNQLMLLEIIQHCLSTQRHRHDDEAVRVC